MNNIGLQRRITAIAAVLFLFSGLPALFGQPHSGDWHCTADFGEFTLTVNSASTHINKVSYSFSSWSCGPVTISGGVAFGKNPGWPISNNQFTIENKLDFQGNEVMTLQGAFAGTDQVSGTWNAVMHGTSCSGTWNIVVGVKGGVPEVPLAFSLAQNYPNPFNPGTTLRFEIDRDGEVEIIIYNQIGQRVRTLKNGRTLAGVHQIHWDGRDDRGLSLPGGVYFARLRSGAFSVTRRMALLR